MFGLPGGMEMLVIGMVVLLMFGNRLPSVMRSLGVGITEFKKGIKGEGMEEEEDERIDSRRDERRLDSHASREDAAAEAVHEEAHR